MKSFSHEDAFTDYNKVQNGEKSITSSTPEKVFCRKANFLKDQKNKRLYTCADGGTNACWKTNLTMHKRINTGVKPFNCTECNSFSQMPVLMTHQRIHIGVKPFKCSTCNKASVRRHTSDNTR
ncbi:oocyte zinc finger protein XlCOF26-like [Microcaecilia unicolor]|uniref:Oocyte zinc finger protein XlCOF26-like n=1 Tax=Microcaecilia unicolor TaxID=1415580 RepID=A0A6P7WVM9_9AMPH|nr:oocyte zinc finger protein XlCOF26-like [Microcaecilia unicolor]